MTVNTEKIWYILQFFFEKVENDRKKVDIVNGV